MNPALEAYKKIAGEITSTDDLQLFLEEGDDMFLLSERASDDDQKDDLSKSEQEELKRVDKTLAAYFKPPLLTKYADMLEGYPVKKWWG